MSPDIYCDFADVQWGGGRWKEAIPHIVSGRSEDIDPVRVFVVARYINASEPRFLDENDIEG
jgi:hypothetical protein